jgi:hypothetical protein
VGAAGPLARSAGDVHVGGSDEVLRQHGLDPDEVIRKPFTPRSFSAAVGRVLEAPRRPKR